MKNRTLNTATLVAIFSLAILVMAGCGNNTAPAPAEKVVNLDELPTLYSAGSDTTVTTCTAADFRWMDCEGVFHPGTKFVPEQGTPITLQGEKADLSKIIGLSDGEFVVIRDGRDEYKKGFPPAPPVKKSEPKPEPVSESSSRVAPWWILEWVMLIAALIGGLMLIFWLMAKAWRAGQWRQAPAPNNARQYSTDREKHSRIQFRDRGHNPMEFTIEGDFNLPIEVSVTMDGQTTDKVRFSPPDHQHNGNRGYRDRRD